jgi:hypothetical protein
MVSESFKHAYVGIIQEELNEGMMDKLKSAYYSVSSGDPVLGGVAIATGALALAGAAGIGMHQYSSAQETHHITNINKVIHHLSSDSSSLQSHLKSIGATDEEAAKGASIAKSVEDSVHPKAGHVAAAMTSDNGKLKIEGASGDTLHDQAKSFSGYLHNNTYVSKEGTLHKLQDAGGAGVPVPHIIAPHILGAMSASSYRPATTRNFVRSR